MRSTVVTAAVLGAFFGGAAGWLVATANAPGVAPDVAPPAGETSADRGTDARALSVRMDRLERALDRLTAALDRVPDRIASQPATDGGDAPGDAPPTRPGRAAPPESTTPRVSRADEWEQLTTEDLEMEADERHDDSQRDNAGAVQRYRALLARGGTPAQTRRWSLRLGDCLIRLGRNEAAADAYLAAYRATAPDDGGERMTALNGLVAAAPPESALARIDEALRSGAFPEYDMHLHQMAADSARNAGMTDRERADLTWLVENRAEWEPKFGWKQRLAALGAR